MGQFTVLVLAGIPALLLDLARWFLRIGRKCRFAPWTGKVPGHPLGDLGFRDVKPGQLLWSRRVPRSAPRLRWLGIGKFLQGTGFGLGRLDKVNWEPCGAGQKVQFAP